MYRMLSWLVYFAIGVNIVGCCEPILDGSSGAGGKCSTASVLACVNGEPIRISDIPAQAGKSESSYFALLQREIRSILWRQKLAEIGFNRRSELERYSEFLECLKEDRLVAVTNPSIEQFRLSSRYLFLRQLYEALVEAVGKSNKGAHEIYEKSGLSRWYVESYWDGLRRELSTRKKIEDNMGMVIHAKSLKDLMRSPGYEELVSTRLETMAILQSVVKNYPESDLRFIYRKLYEETRKVVFYVSSDEALLHNFLEKAKSQGEVGILPPTITAVEVEIRGDTYRYASRTEREEIYILAEGCFSTTVTTCEPDYVLWPKLRDAIRSRTGKSGEAAFVFMIRKIEKPKDPPPAFESDLDEVKEVYLRINRASLLERWYNNAILEAEIKIYDEDLRRKWDEHLGSRNLQGLSSIQRMMLLQNGVTILSNMTLVRRL